MGNPKDDLILKAMTLYLDESVSRDFALRELLDLAGHNDPDLPVEECLRNLVVAYLQLRGQPD